MTIPGYGYMEHRPLIIRVSMRLEGLTVHSKVTSSGTCSKIVDLLSILEVCRFAVNGFLCATKHTWLTQWNSAIGKMEVLNCLEG